MSFSLSLIVNYLLVLIKIELKSAIIQFGVLTRKHTQKVSGSISDCLKESCLSCGCSMVQKELLILIITLQAWEMICIMCSLSCQNFSCELVQPVRSEQPMSLKGASAICKILTCPSIFVILIPLFYFLILLFIQLYKIFSYLLDFIPMIEERAHITFLIFLL